MTDNTPTPPTPSGAGSDEPVDAEVVDPAPNLPAVLPPAAPVPPLPPPDYDERGVPSLDYVRDKIEGRYATSVGAAELVEDTSAARSVEQQEADRAEKARAKLEEIRRSLGR